MVLRKHGMESLMLALNGTALKTEDIPVHINQRQTAIKGHEETGKIPY